MHKLQFVSTQQESNDGGCSIGEVKVLDRYAFWKNEFWRTKSLVMQTTMLPWLKLKECAALGVKEMMG
jgi:hypothetical protein